MTQELATAQQQNTAPTGPTVWVLTTGEDHEGGYVVGVYASKEAAKGPFYDAGHRHPLRAGGCDWVSLEPHTLVSGPQLTA